VGVSLRPHLSLDSPRPFNPAQICCQCAQVWVSLLETISTSGDQTNDLTFNSSWRSFRMDLVVTNSPTFFCTWSATARLSFIAPPLTCVGELRFTSGAYYPLIQTKWLASDYTMHCAGLKKMKKLLDFCVRIHGRKSSLQPLRSDKALMSRLCSIAYNSVFLFH